MLPPAAELVARFLRASGYTETLSSFVAEAGLPQDIGANSMDAITIESILQEKLSFDTSLNFEKSGLDDKHRRWSVTAPSKPVVLSSLPNRSNILSVSVIGLSISAAGRTKDYIAVTTADRKLHLLDPKSPNYEVARSYSEFQESPILDVLAIDDHHLLVASMSGKLCLYDTVQDSMLEERKDHSKYVVKVVYYSEADTIWIATASWDAKVIVYQCTTRFGEDSPQLGKPYATLHLPSIPETLLFVTSPDDRNPVLVVARRDSTFLHFYAIQRSDSSELTFLGKQNLAPHSNAWIAFTPSDVQLSPTDPSLVAVATSTTPHMKLLVVKLLVPTKQSSLLDTDSNLGPDGVVTQASQARAELSIQDREEAAILVKVSTLAPQTQYSTPRLVWRPDGSGVYVSSDDGVVRGIEASTGKLMVALEGHDLGSKLRCLWAGRLSTLQDRDLDGGAQAECLISGGFDQKLIIWQL
ncbi:WD40-repeat-containing domain protein [Ampelomyces quisqualis]|uniref:WD40-repeat-containing domain protein n=1 Tax=Ampelomyces quisqualis TaxID=50730 RepID=A0A6A5QE95_AMPQU|nr:WD40-repeat-containing domain protein [Ampelomyces quisqualis]